MDIILAYPTGEQQLAGGISDIDIIRSIVLEAKYLMPADHVRTDIIGGKDININKIKRNAYYEGLGIGFLIRFSFSADPAVLRGGRVFYNTSPRLANRMTGYLRRAGLMMLPPVMVAKDRGESFLEAFSFPALSIYLGNGNNKSDIWEIGDGYDVAKAIAKIVAYRKALRKDV